MQNLSQYFSGTQEGKSDAVHQLIQDFWKASPEILPLDSGDREVFDLELRKNILEFNWKKGAKLSHTYTAKAIALITFIAGIIRLRENNTLNGHYETLYVVHAEWSTRSIQLWEHLSEKKASVVLIGRPVGRESTNSLLRLLNKKGINTKNIILVRPFSLSTYIKSIVRTFNNFHKFLKVLTCFIKFTGYSPKTKQLSKMLYRILLGSSYRLWLEDQCFESDLCIFGHSGMGDSGAMDYAFRNKGTLTKHWFHGISHGENFFAYSSVAICKSQYDKELTEKYGGYGRATFAPQTMPELTQVDGGWVVLSNWLHPHNKSFQKFGVRDELILLDQVANSARKLNFSPNNIVWKPHPVFYTLSTTIQNKLRRYIATLGFKEWQLKTPFASVSEYSVVICTISTTIIDILKLGILPVVHTLQPYDNIIYVNGFPKALVVHDEDELIHAIQMISNPSDKSFLFNEAWNSVKPGGEITSPETL